MNHRNKTKLIAVVLLSAMLAAGCSSASEGAPASASSSAAAGASAAATSTAGVQAAGEGAVASAKYDEDDTRTEWSADSATTIALNGSSATVTGSGAEAADGVVTISAAGDYVLSGKLEDGRIVVNAPDKVVHLVLNGADVTSKSGTAIHLVEAGKVVVTLQEGTENGLTDAAVYADTSDDAPTAALFSKADLTINGTGKLSVNGNFNDGITSKDDLKIVSGTLIVTAADDGLVGKDLVAVKDGDLSIEAGGDGIKSTNDTDEGKGEIVVEGGRFDIRSANDALQSAASLYIADGTFGLVAGGGHAASTKTHAEEMPGGGFGGRGQWSGEGQGFGQPPEGMERPEGGTPPDGEAASARTRNAPASDIAATENPEAANTAGTEETESTSAKGLKAAGPLVVAGGTFEIDAADDAVHSNTSVRITGGRLSLATGDDAIHADAALAIEGGTIDITSSYEGLESASIAVSGGEIRVIASDDGVNVSDGSGGEPGGFGGGGQAANNGLLLDISGGYLTVDAGGDGLDSNGSIRMSGGTVLVNGPTNSGNGALDYDGTFEHVGGTLIAAGSAGMAQAPSEDGSTQRSIMMTFPQTQEAGTLVTLRDASGQTVAAFAPTKTFQTLLISTPALQSGENYTLSAGGTNDGNGVDGFYESGTTAGGTEVVGFTLGDGAVTYLNESGVTTGSTGMGMGGGRGGMRPGSGTGGGSRGERTP
ncbi:carbohydrate-binding domain-containing protein [Cohnella cellulosilytica]|uniref:Carbohydrate-binding domain-containing protein n=1 Tax=Cohnella cellulosilytica TaxID=986710 RepID=A0ABW2FJF8_9BACL